MGLRRLRSLASRQGDARLVSSCGRHNVVSAVESVLICDGKGEGKTDEPILVSVTGSI